MRLLIDSANDAIVVVAAVLIAFPSVASAEGPRVVQSAADLLYVCTPALSLIDGDSSAVGSQVYGVSNVGTCSGYLTGALQTVDALRHLRLQGPSGESFCFPNLPLEWQLQQPLRIFVNYARAHPEDLHKAAEFLLFQSLVQAFGCSS